MQALNGYGDEINAISASRRCVPFNGFYRHEPQAHGSGCALAAAEVAYLVVSAYRDLYIPPALALLFANLFRLTPGETAGLFMVGVAPGAPLLTRNLARRGFDMHMAASYQVWAALMVPVMIPIVVAAAGKLYGRDIWIPPAALLKQIVLKQFLPLSVGMGIAGVAPNFITAISGGPESAGEHRAYGDDCTGLVQNGPGIESRDTTGPGSCVVVSRWIDCGDFAVQVQ